MDQLQMFDKNEEQDIKNKLARFNASEKERYVEEARIILRSSNTNEIIHWLWSQDFFCLEFGECLTDEQAIIFLQKAGEQENIDPVILKHKIKIILSVLHMEEAHDTNCLDNLFFNGEGI